MTTLISDDEPTATPKGNDRSSGYARNPHDWYVEPPWTVDDLLDAEPFSGGIWDPACGRGTIPIVAHRRGHVSYGSELMDRGFGLTGTNFFDMDRGIAPNIISNPPFGQIERWIQHALRRSTGKVVIFARLSLLAGQARGAWFPTTPLARVWVCSERVPCPPGEIAPPIDAWERGAVEGGFVDYAWYVWSHGHVGEPLIGWLPRRRADAPFQRELAGI